jgi:hypothetical protein
MIRRRVFTFLFLLAGFVVPIAEECRYPKMLP